MDIIQFIEDSELIGDRSLSPAQKTVIKSSYGIALDAEELQLFKLLTGLPEYPARSWAEITCLFGRKSGKSNQIVSNMAIYEAVQPRALARGETGVIMIVASEQERQSKIVFRYILAKLEGSRILRKLIRRQTGSLIELSNGNTVQVYPAHLARVRGAAIIFFAGDEIAYWKHEGKSIDREVLDAVRPGMVEGSKIVKISSPYWMKGEAWNDFKNFHGKPNDHVLVFQGPTELLNPSYSRKQLEKARLRDPVAFLSEYEAQFRADLSAMYDPAILEAAINPDRPAELEPRDGVEYHSFVDTAGGGGKDSYAVAIGHAEGSRIVVDVVRSRPPVFNPEEVTLQYADLVRQYKVSSVTGDKFSGDWSLHAFAKFGIEFERSLLTKSQLYMEAEGLLNSGRLELPARPFLTSQLRNLVRKTRSGGADSVDAEGGAPEDEANVVCGLAVMLSGRGDDRPGTVFLSGHGLSGETKTEAPPDQGGRVFAARTPRFDVGELMTRHDEILEERRQREHKPPEDKD